MSNPSGAGTSLHLGRNMLIGILIMGGIVAIGSMIMGVDPFVAVAIAALPGLVAGPFIGGLITVAQYHGEDEPEPPPEGG